MTCFLGSFNAESHWKEANYVSLPQMYDTQAEAIVQVMDEMQFLFCKSSNDLLITSVAMNPMLKDYLKDIGFSFSCNDFDIRHDSGRVKTIFDQIIENELSFKDKWKALNIEGHDISPFSIAKVIISFCERYSITYNFPSYGTVVKVNSKSFSSQISTLYSPPYSIVIRSSEQLMSAGTKMLENGPILIKDSYGVSGKGILKVTSLNILLRIVSYFSQQESENKIIDFVIEQLLPKKRDFSSHLQIDKDGNIEILNVQQFHNSGFCFNSIENADVNLLRLLHQNKYFNIVENVGNALFNEGYFGPVCIDSLITYDDKVFPIIEINARKSMGTLNTHLNYFLNKFKTDGFFTCIYLKSDKNISFKDIFDIWDKEDLIFTTKKPYGIIPLSANTVDINFKHNVGYPYKGRIYISIIKSKSFTNEEILSAALYSLLNSSLPISASL
ncbi:hypothetical protein FAM09_26455 [Niastella caeni]|uniref:ATP-grasp domain-containing protein n=1 Tax=Niastella caeni TaxID=2569763 RepID=A0A4S8HD80_9BACT|nr:hypothetical protein [Niastella caeni]THU32988.1 hypothetical protein FAM09_26455 [Niastella caeni]